MHKKALIITYYWPPAGGPGVQRWMKFVKYLPEFGVKPIVYSPENASYPLLDYSLDKEVSKNCTVIKQPIFEPYKIARLFSKKHANTISKGIIHKPHKQSFIERILLFIRGNFYIPDARKNWVEPSVKFLSNYIHAHSIDTLITTGPPHSLHLIALRLKQKYDINWIADFRDPWTTIGYHKKLNLTNYAKQKHKQLESDVLKNADQIIVTSYKTKQEFEVLTSKPIDVITNGYDIEQIDDIKLDKKFTLSHIGSLLSERNPELLWKVLSDLIEENKTFKSNLQLRLIGAVSQDVLDSIKQYRLDLYVNKISYVTHKEALRYQRQSQVLLLIEIDSEETKCIIPGKLFEYMVAERPIIAIGPDGSDVSHIVSKTNTGRYFNYSDYGSLKETILEYFEAFKSRSLQTQPIGLKQFSRKALTKKLAKLIVD